MQKNKKSVWLLVLFSFFVLVAFQKPVQADVKMNNRAVTIDGKFDDWDPTAMQELEYYKDATHYNLVSFKNDGQFLYLYTETVGQGRTQTLAEYSWRIQVDGAASDIKFPIDGSLTSASSGTKLAIYPTIVNAWGKGRIEMVIPDGTNRPITGATGFITTEKLSDTIYKDRSEVKIPLTGFVRNPKAVKSFNLLNYSVGNGSFDVPNSTSTNDTTSSSTDSTTSSTNSSTSSTTHSSSSAQPVSPTQPSDTGGNLHQGGSIDINGKFDDWTDHPKETISFFEQDHWVNKQVSFVRDGEYLYMYVDMNPDHLPHDYGFQGSGWEIHIGSNTDTNTDNTIELQLRTSAQPDGKVSISVWIMGINSSNDLFVTPESKGSQMGNYKIPKSIGYVTTENVETIGGQRKRDRAEIKILLAGFLQHPDAIKSMQISNHNLGDQIIEVTGGSTGSTVIVLSGVAIAGGVVYRVSKKKKESSK